MCSSVRVKYCGTGFLVYIISFPSFIVGIFCLDGWVSRNVHTSFLLSRLRSGPLNIKRLLTSTRPTPRSPTHPVSRLFRPLGERTGLLISGGRCPVTSLPIKIETWIGRFFGIQVGWVSFCESPGWNVPLLRSTLSSPVETSGHLKMGYQRSPRDPDPRTYLGRLPVKDDSGVRQEESLGSDVLSWWSFWGHL